MIRLQFKYNPNHVKSGPNGGQFTSGPKAARVGTADYVPVKPPAAVTRDPLSEQLFNITKTGIQTTFGPAGSKLIDDRDFQSIKDHPDFGGSTPEEVKTKIFTAMFNREKGHMSAVAFMSGVQDGGMLRYNIEIVDASATTPVIRLRMESLGRGMDKKINVHTVLELRKFYKGDTIGNKKEKLSGFPMDTLKEGEYYTTLTNNEIFLHKSVAGKGIGTRIIAQQVKYAELYNVTAAFLTAGGGGPKATPHKGGGEDFMSGYYAWPRLGYDNNSSLSYQRDPAYVNKKLSTNIDAYYKKQVTKAKKDPAKIALADAERQKSKEILARADPKDGFLSSLMKTAEGRQLWKDYGYQEDLYFDMRKGSPQKAIFAAYLAEKGIVI